MQFAGRGVRTNAISPGPIETPLLMDWLLKDEAAKQLRLARNPTGRFGKPEEIVNVGDLPRVGRVAVDEWRKLRGRWRHHRQLLLTAMAATAWRGDGDERSSDARTMTLRRARAEADGRRGADEVAEIAAETATEDDQDKAPALSGAPIDPGSRRLAIGVDVGGSGIKAAARRPRHGRAHLAAPPRARRPSRPRRPP